MGLGTSLGMEGARRDDHTFITPRNGEARPVVAAIERNGGVLNSKGNMAYVYPRHNLGNI